MMEMWWRGEGEEEGGGGGGRIGGGGGINALPPSLTNLGPVVMKDKTSTDSTWGLEPETTDTHAYTHTHAHTHSHAQTHARPF